MKTKAIASTFLQGFIKLNLKKVAMSGRHGYKAFQMRLDKTFTFK
jgi:hypothetical protein